MPFYIATANSDGSQGTDALLLTPGPLRVEYPQEALGALLETPDGITIQQQPSGDGRKRSWVWDRFQPTNAGYARIWPTLESLRARYRKEAGLSPYVYLKETESGLFRKRTALAQSGAGSVSGFVFTATSGTPFTGLTLAGGFITVSSQTRAILGNTATTITVGDAWSATYSAQTAQISYWTDAFFKCRVVEVSRKTREDGGIVNYLESRLSFVIEDASWNYLG